MNKILSKTKKHGSKTGMVDLNQTNASMGTIDLGGGQNRPTLASQPITLNLPPQTMSTISTPATTTTSSSSSSGGGGLFGNSRFGTVGKSSKDDKKKKKIDKSQISGPTGFKVVQHVGLSTNNTTSNFEVIFTFLFFLKKINLERE